MGMKSKFKKVGKMAASPVRVPIKKIKEHSSRKKEHPEDDIPEENDTENVENVNIEETDQEKEITPGFAFSANYTFDENGNPIENNSSNPIPQNNVTNDAITQIIMNNSTIKELVPNIKPEDISVYNNMLLLNVKRENEVETFRIDLVNGKIMIQAPLNIEYISMETGVKYKYASVDVDSDIGRNILINSNYIISLKDLDPLNSIMRVEQDAA